MFGKIQCTKPSEYPLPAKQAITVGSNSSFNLKFLNDWSNFDLPKLMAIERISFDDCIMVVSH